MPRDVKSKKYEQKNREVRDKNYTAGKNDRIKDFLIVLVPNFPE